MLLNCVVILFEFLCSELSFRCTYQKYPPFSSKCVKSNTIFVLLPLFCKRCSVLFSLKVSLLIMGRADSLIPFVNIYSRGCILQVPAFT